MMKLFSEVIGIVIAFSYYISLLTGFFAVYYYDPKKYIRIRFSDYNDGDFQHLLLIAMYFLINTFITLFYDRILGLVIYSILIILGILISIIVKRNMKNIITIYNPIGRKIIPIRIKFRRKLMTTILSPLSNDIFLIIIIIFIISIVVGRKF